jgi:hypothetical protein
MPVETVVKVTKTVQDAANKVVRTSIEEMETFLQTFAAVVHDNHIVLFEMKATLATLYGGTGTWVGFGLAHEKMSNDQCKRKQQLCKEVIKVANKICPGRNSDRGLIMFEYYLALSFMAFRNLVRSPITYQTASLKYLKEALIILNDSRKGSYDRSIAEYIKNKGLIADCELTLMMMRNSIRN